MEIYLNIAEWGPNGQFGAEAGRRYAFNKSARDLIRAARRRCWPRCCPIRNVAAPSSRAPAVRRLAGIYEARGAAQAALASCAKVPR